MLCINALCYVVRDRVSHQFCQVNGYSMLTDSSQLVVKHYIWGPLRDLRQESHRCGHVGHHPMQRRHGCHGGLCGPQSRGERNHESRSI